MSFWQPTKLIILQVIDNVIWNVCSSKIDSNVRLVDTCSYLDLRGHCQLKIFFFDFSRFKKLYYVRNLINYFLQQQFPKLNINFFHQVSDMIIHIFFEKSHFTLGKLSTGGCEFLLRSEKSAKSSEKFKIASLHAHKNFYKFVILLWVSVFYIAIPIANDIFNVLYLNISAKPSSASSSSPKSTTSVDGLDGEDGGRSVGSPGPKVPPLKIVIPPVESEQGSRNGKNTTRHHPYVVVSNDETSTAVSTITTSPSSPAVQTTASKEEAHSPSSASATLTSEEQRGQQRVLRSSNRYCKNWCWFWRHILISG